MNDYVSLLVGIACAGIGGEFFVRGTVGLAASARIPPGIVGATIAAFATSSPELAVAINSAVEGKPSIALGNALGANVVNVALILAIALLISGIQAPRSGIKRDFPVALLVPVITGVLFIDGELSRLDGIVMLGAFIVWLITAVIEARRASSAATEVLATEPMWKAVVACLVGLALLTAAGEFIVDGARGIAYAFGIGEFVIGATIVAVGTTVPELATSVIAKMRGHDEVGLGTILGSNIFNGLCIVGLAATIHPIAADPQIVFVALTFGLVALACSFPDRTGFIARRRGIVLLVLYVTYLTAVLQGAA